MAGIKVNLTAELDDGRTLTVLADQRDWAAAEAAEIDSRSMKTTWVRFMAWNALTRARTYTGSWETFNTVDCVEAIDSIVEEPAGAEGGLDPGRKAPSGGS